MGSAFLLVGFVFYWQKLM